MASLSSHPFFSQAGISISRSEVVKINSHHHNILQVTDIILGAMQSRLNEVHTKPKPPSKRRSKRAKAKEIVYKRIKDRIWKMYPNFNVGVSTASPNRIERHNHPYRHWCFVPTGSSQDRSRGKKR